LDVQFEDRDGARSWDSTWCASFFLGGSDFPAPFTGLSATAV